MIEAGLLPGSGPCWLKRGREREGGTAKVSKPNLGSSVSHCHSHFISENLVTWPHLTLKETEKYSLASHFPRDRWKMDFWWTTINISVAFLLITIGAQWRWRFLLVLFISVFWKPTIAPGTWKELNKYLLNKWRSCGCEGFPPGLYRRKHISPRTTWHWTFLLYHMRAR